METVLVVEEHKKTLRMLLYSEQGLLASLISADDVVNDT